MKIATKGSVFRKYGGLITVFADFWWLGFVGQTIWKVPAALNMSASDEPAHGSYYRLPQARDKLP
jgi:hypothetical protein